MLPDIDSLALFVRAAELRSLTKAAEASHIGLAAASRRMALLEHRFKTALLERSPLARAWTRDDADAFWAAHRDRIDDLVRRRGERADDSAA